MKIAFFELEGWEEKILSETFPKDELYFSKDKITPLDKPKKTDFEIISVFTGSRLTADVLALFPDLKLITTRSTGFDHVDLKVCKKRGIPVAYAPGYGDNTVAEFAFGLILNLTRKIYQAIDQIKEAESFSLEGLRGVDLKGKTIGIIGTGRIGKEMIKIAKGFGMNVLGFDMFPDAEFGKIMNFQYVPFEDVLKNSDIISVHCPLNEKTRHLINKENISFIKKGAYLVNTARGGIVETDALVKALKEGILAGAGIDVIEEEGETIDEMKFLTETEMREDKLRTVLENHVLMKMPNVLITPHNAFNSQEALGRILNTTLENIKAFIGGNPINIVKN